VGVTRFVEGTEPPIAVLEIPPETERDQLERLRTARARRDAAAAGRAVERLSELARTDANLVEPLVECARAGCTEGEIVHALREVFGSYTETPRF
jgi:methylmalonyl-CoA mutase N-terminal domain/subunit